MMTRTRTSTNRQEHWHGNNNRNTHNSHYFTVSGYVCYRADILLNHSTEQPYLWRDLWLTSYISLTRQTACRSVLYPFPFLPSILLFWRHVVLLVIPSTIHNFFSNPSAWASSKGLISMLITKDNSLWTATWRILRFHFVPQPLQSSDGSWAKNNEEKA